MLETATRQYQLLDIQKQASEISAPRSVYCDDVSLFKTSFWSVLAVPVKICKKKKGHSRETMRVRRLLCGGPSALDIWGLPPERP